MCCIDGEIRSRDLAELLQLKAVVGCLSSSNPCSPRDLVNHLDIGRYCTYNKNKKYCCLRRVMNPINGALLQDALLLLGQRLQVREADPLQLVVCGGSALIALDLISRSTSDVDVVAMVSAEKVLYSPAPFPPVLKDAANEVASLLGLPEEWLNHGPSSDSGGLFQCGLPSGLLQRSHPTDFGDCLRVYFIDRIDQIFFKVYAAADRMGVHVDDLIALDPAPEELVEAALWCMSHDPSEEFRHILISMYQQLGFEDAADDL